ncbi:MAG TPA: hypothetical protein VLS45_04285 [Methylomicrobium sp.]|nr:hypothetical protein [Methylomicrobium sp.]
MNTALRLSPWSIATLPRRQHRESLLRTPGGDCGQSPPHCYTGVIDRLCDHRQPSFACRRCTGMKFYARPRDIITDIASFQKAALKTELFVKLFGIVGLFM